VLSLLFLPVPAPRLTQAHSRPGTGHCPQNRYAISILDAIGLQRLVYAWPVLKYFDREFENAALDRWLVLALLEGADAPLVCERDRHGRFRVFRCTNPFMQEEVPEERENFKYLLDLLRDHTGKASKHLVYGIVNDAGRY
jgi:hypothetical protein